MTLEKERFEAWLFSQPDKREFDYLNTTGCMGCSFVKETTNINNPAFGGITWGKLDNYGDWPLPDWFRAALISMPRFFTAADTKSAWRKLFPEVETQEPVKQHQST